MPLVEEPLEGPQHRPTRLASSEVQLALRVEGDERGDGVRVLEGNDRVVPPIDHGYDRMGSAKIDAKPHERSVPIDPGTQYAIPHANRVGTSCVLCPGSGDMPTGLARVAYCVPDQVNRIR